MNKPIGTSTMSDLIKESHNQKDQLYSSCSKGFKGGVSMISVQCEVSTPSFCSEGDQTTDCSSILSSFSCEHFENGKSNDCPIETPQSFKEGSEAVQITDLVFPHCLTERFVTAVSQSNTDPGSTDTSLDDTQMDDEDTISLLSLSYNDDMENLREDQSSFLISTSLRMEPKPLLDDIPDELICQFSSFLDVKSLCAFRSVSKRFRLLSSLDEAGWGRHCQSLWSEKAFVVKEASLLYKTHNAMRAYQMSIFDSKNREELRPEELCFDTNSGEGIVWDFRFKETAGADWTSIDPWWAGGQARKLVFLTDGTVKQIVQSPNSSTFILQPPFRDLNQHGGRDNERSLLMLEMTWRFVDKPMDLPLRPSGSYLRLTVEGRDVPTYVVHRSRSGDWGFVIESCWGVYSSTPLPRRQILEPQHLDRPARMRLRRTRDGARWLNVDGIETESEDEEVDDEQAVRRFSGADSTFSMSTRRQWREALLYNYGAVSLPEGEHATAEFDRVWSRSIRQRRRRVASMLNRR